MQVNVFDTFQFKFGKRLLNLSGRDFAVTEGGNCPAYIPPGFASNILQIHSLRTTFMKSSTFRFINALLTFRCCSMLIPVKKVKIISASTVAFIAGLAASTFLAIRSLRKAGPWEPISCAADGSTANWFMELTEK